MNSEPRSRGLAIFSMALGLTALLTLIVSFWSLRIGLLPAAFLGMIAVILGCTAISLRQRPLVATATGIGAGSLTVVLALVFGYYAQPVVSPDTATGTDPSPAPTPQGTVIDATFPANMVSGGVRFDSDFTPHTSAPLEPGSVPAPHEANADGAVEIIVYVDYRCPHCLSFDQVHAATLDSVVSSGQASLEIRPLTFLDRADETRYSSRAANLFACTVDTQPADAWAVHKMLLHPTIQPQGQAASPSDEFLLAAADVALGGSGDYTESSSPISSTLRDCVADGRFMPFAQAMTEWTFEHPIIGALDSSLRVDGTPYVLVAGEHYPGSAHDPEAFQSFLTTQGLILD